MTVFLFKTDEKFLWETRGQDIVVPGIRSFIPLQKTLHKDFVIHRILSDTLHCDLGKQSDTGFFKDVFLRVLNGHKRCSAAVGSAVIKIAFFT